MKEWWVYYDFTDYKYIDYDDMDCDYSEYAIYWYINGIPVNAGTIHLNPTCFLMTNSPSKLRNTKASLGFDAEKIGTSLSCFKNPTT